MSRTRRSRLRNVPRSGGGGGVTSDDLTATLPRPQRTTFTRTTVVPIFGDGHPLANAVLPPGGSIGEYAVDAVLGIPGASPSAFGNVNWSTIERCGDSLIELPGGSNAMNQEWRVGGPEGERVITYDLRANANQRLATAHCNVRAEGFEDALESAHNVLESFLSALSFHYDVPIEITCWRLIEKQTGSVQFVMKLLGVAKQLDSSLTGLTTPESRELLSTWREASNASSPMVAALGFYKIIDRIHKYRVDRGTRTRGQQRPYYFPRDRMPERFSLISADYELSEESFKPYYGKKFTSVWEGDLRGRVRNAVTHLRDDAPSLTTDRAADVEACRDAVPVLHYLARTMMQQELADQIAWPA